MTLRSIPLSQLRNDEATWREYIESRQPLTPEDAEYIRHLLPMPLPPDGRPGGPSEETEEDQWNDRSSARTRSSRTG